ncbi:hypothetical protein DHD05_06945 [Arenibacter sp. N53]|nr:hypothetical protein [Arenibacter sp. N53]
MFGRFYGFVAMMPKCGFIGPVLVLLYVKINSSFKVPGWNNLNVPIIELRFNGFKIIWLLLIQPDKLVPRELFYHK